MSETLLSQPATFHENGNGLIREYASLADAIRDAMDIMPSSRNMRAFIETVEGNRYGWDAIQELSTRLVGDKTK